MTRWKTMLAAALAAFAALTTTPNNAALAQAQTPTLTLQQRTALYAAIEARPARNGQIVNDCDEAVTPEIRAVDLGGAVGQAYVVAIGGGPNMASCYGNSQWLFYLVKPEAPRYRVLFTGQGYLGLLPANRAGVRDLAVGGPGMRFPRYSWDGRAYRQSGWVADGAFPETLY